MSTAAARRKEHPDVRVPLSTPPDPPGYADRGPHPGGAQTVAAHLAYLERLAAAGVIPLFGRTETTDASTFGIVIFRAGSPDEARQVMADDPAVRARVMRAEVFPFRVVGVGPGLLSRT